MSIRVISATEVSRDLSGFLNKVHYQGQSFEIKRGREIVACLVPCATSSPRMTIGGLIKLLSHLPALDKNDAEEFSQTIETIRSQMRHEENSWD